RALPTPCRAKFRFDADINIGRTLLEEACHEARGAPFLEASTLLEALQEHLQAQRRGVRIADAVPPPFALSLDSLIDPSSHLGEGRKMETEVFDLDAGQCVLPCSMADYYAVVQAKTFAALRGPPGGLSQPERFESWVANGCVGRSPAPGECLVITADGSYFPHIQAIGWAIVLSLRGQATNSVEQFIGCCFGSASAFLSEDTTNAFGAEVVALLWAAVAALQLPIAGEVLFRADNQSALHGAEGNFDMPAYPACVALQCFHMAFRFHCRHGVRYEYVPGHQGDAANELADALAKFGAVRGIETAEPFTFRRDFWLREGAGAARWLPHFCVSVWRPWQLPRTDDNFFTWGKDAAAPRLTAAQLMHPFTRPLAGVPSNTDSSAVTSRSCVLATFNALSLLPPDKGSEGSAAGLHGATGRITLLNDSLARASVGIAGIQEARTPAGTYCTKDYRRFSAGCTERKGLGVELWVRLEDDLQGNKVAILHNDPTRLIARLAFASLQLLVFVGHAPHRGRTCEDRVAWWQATAKLCSAVGTDAEWLLLIDGNCRVGSQVSEHIGSHHADPQDEGGQSLHDLLAQLGAWLPSTFEASMVGPGGTFLQKQTHCLQRCDYIGVPLGWKRWRIRAEVAPAISAGHAVPDHFALLTSCDLHFHSPARRQKVKRIDPAALRRPENADRISAIIAAAPPVTWDVSVHDHAAIVVEHLFTGLSAAFPLQGRRMRKSFLSEEAGVLHAEDKGMDFDALDKRAHIDQLADDVQAADKGDVHVALKRLLRPRKFRRQGPDPLPKLKRTDGSLCTTPAEIIQAWRSHFASLEGGREVSADQLVQDCLEFQRQQPALDTLEWATVPDLWALSSAFRQVEPAKAGGPDGLPPAICRKFSCQMATLFYPVLLKALAYMAEPIGLKGGSLFRCFLEYAKRKSLPAAIVFTDISSAYYAVIRELIAGGRLRGASLADIAASLSLTDEDLQLLQSFVADDPVLSDSEGGGLLAALTRELHQGTWFLMRQDNVLVATQRGTRPGSSLADILYSLLFTKVLDRRGAFGDEFQPPRIPWSGARDLSPFDARKAGNSAVLAQDLIYADDLATCLLARTAGELPTAVQRVAGCNMDVLAGHGLKTNLGPKKTASVIAPAGPGARDTRQRVFSVAGGRLPVLRDNGPGVWLQAVPSYKHLGSVITFDGSLVAEVKSRLHAASICFREGRRDVFCSARINLSRRVELFKLHVLTSLFAGSGAWPWMCEAAWKKLEAGLFNMARQLVRIPHDVEQNWTRQQVHAALGLLPLSGQLAVQRLRFLAQIVKTGPNEVFALLQQAPRAMQAFSCAESWMQEALQHSGSLGPFGSKWDAWCEVFRQPGKWKGMLRRAEAWHLGKLRAEAALQAFSRQYWERLPVPVVELPSAQHACMQCRIAFHNCHAWSAHVMLGFNQDEGTVLASCEGTPKCELLHKGSNMTKADFELLLTTDMFNISNDKIDDVLSVYADASNTSSTDWYWTATKVYGDYAIACPSLRAAHQLAKMSSKETFLYEFCQTPRARAPSWAGIFGE
ncbi:unnamed protein product, partial [Symbiodinium sp. CCMP2456]